MHAAEQRCSSPPRKIYLPWQSLLGSRWDSSPRSSARTLDATGMWLHDTRAHRAFWKAATNPQFNRQPWLLQGASLLAYEYLLLAASSLLQRGTGGVGHQPAPPQGLPERAEDVPGLRTQLLHTNSSWPELRSLQSPRRQSQRRDTRIPTRTTTSFLHLERVTLPALGPHVPLLQPPR